MTGETQWEVPTGPATAGAGGGTVRASHILAKHTGSRRPASWRQDPITRSKAEAIERIKAFRAEIEEGKKDFAEIARTESDCSSAKAGGDLGEFGRGQMQKPFEDATVRAVPRRGVLWRAVAWRGECAMRDGWAECSGMAGTLASPRLGRPGLHSPCSWQPCASVGMLLADALTLPRYRALVYLPAPARACH